MKNLKWYYQILVVVLICGAGLAGVWYQFLSPMQDQITAKQKTADDLRKEVARSLIQKKIFEQFKAESLELAKKLDVLKTELPLDKETDQIIKSVRAEADAAGVRILRIALRPTIDHDVYTEWPWDMEVVGTYNGTGTFFDKVRQLPRIVNITNVKLSSRASEGERAFTESIGALFTATTFIYHEEQVASTAPVAQPVK